MTKNFFVGLLMAGALGSGVAATNLVSNGSFEVDTPLVGGGVPNGYMYTTTLTDWLVGGNPTVLFNSTYRPVSDGAQAVQIERNGDKLSQAFTTVLGEQYLLSFDLSSWWLAAPANLAELSVSVGPVQQTFTASDTIYTTHTLLFTASATLTQLSFQNLGSTGISYPQIDNVSVVAVPETGTYAMLLAGLAFVGFLAKRRNT